MNLFCLFEISKLNNERVDVNKIFVLDIEELKNENVDVNNNFALNIESRILRWLNDFDVANSFSLISSTKSIHVRRLHRCFNILLYNFAILFFFKIQIRNFMSKIELIINEFFNSLITLIWLWSTIEFIILLIVRLWNI